MGATTEPTPRAVLLAEFLATAFLLFLGTGAPVVDALSGGAIGHGGVAAAFGLVVTVLIYTFGDVSGAHMNPAVTLAFAAAGRFPWRRVPGYVLAQTLGALAGSGLLRLLFPTVRTLGPTLPAGPVGQSFGLEVILTLLLMLVVLRVSTGAKEKGLTAGLVVGGLVALEALVAGPICGASMNPARSLAPALVGGQLQHLWVYLLAPTLGALLAVPLARAVQPVAEAPLAPAAEVGNGGGPAVENQPG
ncbi:aquaporin [Hymenobacter sp. 15J16-1T3B]|uniref:MIP/aquaporin family protein n=1 Tax=Hymenobacter sp. 15J16-1T3B TaxID=2886941 RepID=UPI001D0F9ACB|nr:aquaporin [Hymenobacter sp. 15J16-1T3B]MCC3158673.1 aquaporin [Hymenobacter sp. 15J16-1T3B]